MITNWLSVGTIDTRLAWLGVPHDFRHGRTGPLSALISSTFYGVSSRSLSSTKKAGLAWSDIDGSPSQSKVSFDNNVNVEADGRPGRSLYDSDSTGSVIGTTTIASAGGAGQRRMLP
jgi:hypothetical protein